MCDEDKGETCSSYLNCNSCQKQEKVVDLGNDDAAMIPMESTPETQAKDLITTLLT